MNPITVYVLAALEETHILYRLATEKDGLSPLHRLENQGKWFGGNPHSLYGKHAKQFANTDDVNIVVCHATGNLS